jgi:hypothetical protein
MTSITESTVTWQNLLKSPVSELIRPLPGMKILLTKIFAEENRNQIFLSERKAAENLDVQFYYNIGNLIISVKFFAEWEEEMKNLIRHFRSRQEHEHETCLTMIHDFCEKNKFFYYLGFGPLIKNLNFLEILMKEQKKRKYIGKLNQELLMCLYPLEHQNAGQQLEVMSEQENCRIQDMLNAILIIGFFSKSLSSKIKEVIIDKMKEYNFTESHLQYSTLHRNIYDAVKELPAMKSFLENYKTCQNPEKFISDWIYPPLHQTTATPS